MRGLFIEMWLIRFFLSETCNLDPEIVSSLLSLFFFFFNLAALSLSWDMQELHCSMLDL